MLTLRFARNGLLVPVIDFFTRGHVAAETVALRAAQSGRGSDDPAEAASQETRT
jgi:hypothetical protein